MFSIRVFFINQNKATYFIVILLFLAFIFHTLKRVTITKRSYKLVTRIVDCRII